MPTVESKMPDNVPPIFSPILCTIPHAAAMIGRGTTFIYEAIATGQIEAVKSDKRTLIVVDSLRRYAASLPHAKIKPTTRRQRKPPRERSPLIGHNKPPPDRA
jgi:hypothetical protein